MRYYHPFPEAIPHSEAGSSRVTHPSATKIFTEANTSVRLACVKRAASVRPEPGSNSLKSCIYSFTFVNAYIDPKHHKLSLAITFFSVSYDFLVFSDFSKSVRFKLLSSSPNSFKGFIFLRFFLVVHCSIFKIPLVVRCHYLFVISSERQLIHYITFSGFCQVNKL